MGAGASLQTAQLLEDIKGSDSVVRQSALTEVLAAVSVKERIPVENIRDIKLIPALIEPLISKDNEAREMAVEIYLKLAIDPEIRAIVKEQAPRLQPLVLEIVEKEDGIIFAKSCRLCGRLGYTPDISLRRLVQSLQKDSGKGLIITCEALWGLSVLPTLRGPMAAPDLPLVEALSAICCVETNDARLHACSALVNLSCDPKNRENVMKANSFLPALVNLLSISEAPICLKSIGGSCCILRNITSSAVNKLAVSAPNARLVPAVAALLLYDFAAGGISGLEWLKVSISACSILSTLASCQNAHTYICSSAVDVLAAFSRILNTAPELYGGSVPKEEIIVGLAEAKDFTCIALCHLSSVVSNQTELLASRYALLDNLVTILASPPLPPPTASNASRHRKSLDPRLNACLVLSNIAIGGAKNSELMIDAGLVVALVNLLNDFARGCSSTTSSTVDGDNPLSVASMSPSDIKLIVGACEVLKHLAAEESNKRALIKEEVRVVPALVGVLGRVSTGMHIHSTICISLVHTHHYIRQVGVSIVQCVACNCSIKVTCNMLMCVCCECSLSQ